MKTREPDRPAVPPERAELPDDPFARAIAEGERSGSNPMEPTVTVVGPLAQRDPYAPVEVSDEFHVAGAATFEDVLRRAQRRGFLAGVATGALAAIVAAAALSWAISGRSVQVPPAQAPDPLTPEERGSPPTPPEARSGGPPGAAGPRASARGEDLAAPASGRRQAPPAPPPVPRAMGDEPRVLSVPGLDLRATEPGAPGGTAAPGGPDAPAPDGTPPAPEPTPPAAAAPEPVPGRRLDDGEVSAALAARRDAIEGCLAAHRGDAAGAGPRRFHLVVTIDRTGQVAGARIDDEELGATELGACLVRVARGVSVSPFDGDPVHVALPLRFAGAE